MSQENENLIRAGYDAINRWDLSAAKELADPDCEIKTRFTSVAGRTYHGHEGVALWFADVEDSWENVDQTPERFIEVDAETTIALVGFKAQGRGSGVQVDQSIAAIWTIRDGKVVRLETHASLEEAREAAGLPES